MRSNAADWLGIRSRELQHGRNLPSLRSSGWSKFLHLHQFWSDAVGQPGYSS